MASWEVTHHEPPARGADFEGLTLELQGLQPATAAPEPKFTLEAQLENGIQMLNTSESEQGGVRTLCSLLESADSSAVGSFTKTRFNDVVAPLLLACINTALKARRQALDVPADGSPNATAPFDLPTSTYPIEPVRPTVLIVNDSDRILHRLFISLELLLQKIHIALQLAEVDNFVRRQNSDLQGLYYPVEIAVCGSYKAAAVFEQRSEVRLDNLKLVLWHNAHRHLGPRFRMLPLEHGKQWAYRTASNIRRLRNVRIVVSGSTEDIASLSAVKRAMLGTTGESKMVKIDKDGRGISYQTSERAQAADRQHHSRRLGEARTLQSPSASNGKDFSQLPPELRNGIYRHAIQTGRTYCLAMFRPTGSNAACRAVSKSFSDEGCYRGINAFDHVRGKWRNTSTSDIFTLSYVNKRLATETLPIIYAGNTFVFRTIGCMNVFLRGIGSVRQHVRHIRISDDLAYLYTKPSSVFQSLQPLLGLRHFAISYTSIDGGSFSGKPPVTLDCFFEDIKGYLLRWHEANKDAKGSSNVLDVVRITRRCCKCRTEIHDPKCDTPKYESDVIRNKLHKPGRSPPCTHNITRRRKDKHVVARVATIRAEFREKLTQALAVSQPEEESFEEILESTFGGDLFRLSSEQA